jgi:hypothetical protein
MKFKASISLALLLIAAGCASEGWQTHSVPFPASTPFDANPFARQAYLDGFRSGYVAQQQQKGAEFLSGPYGRARELGFRAGAAEARSEMMDAAAAAPSTPLR